MFGLKGLQPVARCDDGDNGALLITAERLQLGLKGIKPLFGVLVLRTQPGLLHWTRNARNSVHQCSDGVLY
ncbi:hypothetical protein AB4Z19_15420 [Pseudoduganella sp. RAF19]|uniref:hypothetical protein n=1 Tax=Bacteria TaxID=2 RepID=UPI003F943D52